MTRVVLDDVSRRGVDAKLVRMEDSELQTMLDGDRALEAVVEGTPAADAQERAHRQATEALEHHDRRIGA